MGFLGGLESACQYRRCGFDPQSEKIPHATEPPSPCHSYRACALEPGNRSYRAPVLQLLKPACLRVCAPLQEKPPQ